MSYFNNNIKIKDWKEFVDEYSNIELEEAKTNFLKLCAIAGGKSKLLELLLSIFPKHKLYGEGCGGSYQVLLNKTRSQIEWINDIDPNMLALSFSFSFLWDKLIEVLEHEIHSQALLQYLISQANDLEERTMLYKAIRKLYLVYHSYGAKGSTFAFSTNSPLKRSIKLNKADVIAIRNRLDGVHIFCENIIKFMKHFREAKSAMIYFDPPYPDFDGYEHLFTEADHRQMALEIKKFDPINVKTIISYNNKPRIRKIYEELDFNIYDVETAASLANKYGDYKKREELIITNFDLERSQVEKKTHTNIEEFFKK